MGWEVGPEGTNFPDNPMMASIRQIAYETLMSISLQSKIS